MKQNNSTELLGCSFNNIYRKMSPPRSPDPKSAIVYWFCRIFYRKSAFSHGPWTNEHASRITYQFGQVSDVVTACSGETRPLPAPTISYYATPHSCCCCGREFSYGKSQIIVKLLKKIGFSANIKKRIARKLRRTICFIWDWYIFDFVSGKPKNPSWSWISDFWRPMAPQTNIIYLWRHQMIPIKSRCFPNRFKHLLLLESSSCRKSSNSFFGKVGSRKIPKSRLIHYCKYCMWDQYLSEPGTDYEILNLWNFETLKQSRVIAFLNFN